MIMVTLAYTVFKNQLFKYLNALIVIILERQNQLEIEKNDFLKILLIFNFCREMNKYAYIFFYFSLPLPWQP